MRVVLGNRAAIIRRGVEAADGSVSEEVVEGPKGKQATVIDFPDEHTLAEAFANVTHPAGVWAYHAADGKKPAWVASDSPGLAALLAEHFGGIEVRDMLDPYDPETKRVGKEPDPDPEPDPEPRTGGGGAGAALLSTMLLLSWLFFVLSRVTPWLKTNAGNDFQAAQMAGAASATAVAKWVALTANATAPAAGDTTLTAEIATGGGGLIRKAGTYAHTTGAASYTLTTTFTANGSDSLPVTIAKRGVFDASSSGTLVFSTLLSATATLTASGDQLTITDTVTL